MATVIEIERKSDALRHPAGHPCLASHYTINLTAGCPSACRYCYAQSFRHHPGVGKVLFYANTLEMVRRELARRRRKPELVFFSSGCEPFNPDSRILSAQYEIMKLLLDNSISIIAVTKSKIPTDFVELFAEQPDRVCIEVSITTVDERIRQLMEPGAASIEERLQTLSNLVARGIPNKAKMAPFIPGLTDGDESFTTLCRALAAEGVRHASATYLFLRGALMKRLNVRTAEWSFGEMVNRVYTEEVSGYGESGVVRMPSSEYRAERFQFMRRTALEHGIDLRFCRCRNSSVTKDFCHDLPEPLKREVPQGELFASANEGTDNES